MGKGVAVRTISANGGEGIKNKVSCHVKVEKPDVTLGDDKFHVSALKLTASSGTAMIYSAACSTKPLQWELCPHRDTCAAFNRAHIFSVVSATNSVNILNHLKCAQGTEKGAAVTAECSISWKQGAAGKNMRCRVWVALCSQMLFPHAAPVGYFKLTPSSCY